MWVSARTGRAQDFPQGGNEMSEEEHRRVNEEETDEVEAHGHGKSRLANEEAPAEGEGDDDVEAHVKRANHPKRL